MYLVLETLGGRVATGLQFLLSYVYIRLQNYELLGGSLELSCLYNFKRLAVWANWYPSFLINITEQQWTSGWFLL